MRHVRGTRHARQEALDLRILGDPVLLVPVLFLQRIGRVGNLAPALDDTETAGNGADRAEGENLDRRQRAVGSFTQMHGGLGHVQFEVVVRLVESLPDAAQIGLAVGRTIGLEVLGTQGHRHQC